MSGSKIGNVCAARAHEAPVHDSDREHQPVDSGLEVSVFIKQPVDIRSMPGFVTLICKNCGVVYVAANR